MAKLHNNIGLSIPFDNFMRLDNGRMVQSFHESFFTMYALLHMAISYGTDDFFDGHSRGGVVHDAELSFADDAFKFVAFVFSDYHDKVYIITY